jgi:hypothetical protein
MLLVNNWLKKMRLFVIGLILTFGNISCYSPNGYQDQNVSPGTFVGTWTSNDHVFPCTTLIKEADSIFNASITNDSTMEILSLSGFRELAGPDHSFFIDSINTNFLGDTDKVFDYYFVFAIDGNSFNYSFHRGQEIVGIICYRK